MVSKKSTPAWSDVKTKLADFDRAGLMGVIQVLSLASKDSQVFLQANATLPPAKQERMFHRNQEISP